MNIIGFYKYVTYNLIFSQVPNTEHCIVIGKGDLSSNYNEYYIDSVNIKQLNSRYIYKYAIYFIELNYENNVVKTWMLKTLFPL